MAHIKIAFFATVVACASGMPQLYGPPAPSYGPAPIVVQEPIVAPHYNFQYGVSDALTGQQFSHGENRDNYNTAGEYRVNLPDGRVQIVTYKADEAGYVADVKYEGEAVFPPEPVKPTYAAAPAPRVVAVAPAPIAAPVLAPRLVAAAPVLAPRVVAAPAFAPRLVAAPVPVAVATPILRQAVVPVARTFGFRTLPAEAAPAAVEAEAAPVAVEAEAAPAAVEAEAAPVAVEAEAAPVAVEAEAAPVAVEAEAAPVAAEAAPAEEVASY